MDQMLCMSKVLKVAQYTQIRAVMLCMLKVSKEVQNGFTHLCSELSYYSTDFQSKKSFKKLRLRVFQPMYAMYVEGCQKCQRLK